MWVSLALLLSEESLDAANVEVVAEDHISGHDHDVALRDARLGAEHQVEVGHAAHARGGGGRSVVDDVLDGEVVGRRPPGEGNWWR